MFFKWSLMGLLALFFTSAQAAIITWSFEGELDYVSSEPTGQLQQAFQVGNTFSGYLSFDTDASDTVASTTQGVYPGAVVDAGLVINGIGIDTGSSDPYESHIVSQYLSYSRWSHDLYLVSSGLSRQSFGDWQTTQFNLEYLFPNGYLGENDTIREEPFGLADTVTGYAEFEMTFTSIGSNRYLGLTGVITSVQAVPVPAAIWLFGSGLMGLAGLARRKNV